MAGDQYHEELHERVSGLLDMLVALGRRLDSVERRLRAAKVGGFEKRGGSAAEAAPDASEEPAAEEPAAAGAGVV